MDATDIEHRPAKKRRFFFESETEEPQNEAASSAQVHASTETTTTSSEVETHQSVSNTPGTANENGSVTDTGFDSELFASVVGHAPPEHVIRKLRQLAGNDVQRAVNLYFDGSWENNSHSHDAPAASSLESQNLSHPPSNSNAEPVEAVTEPSSDAQTSTIDYPNTIAIQPDARYVGAFGVGAWSTRSGTDLIKHGDVVNIERTKLQPPTKRGRGGKLVARPNQKGDVITRFTNSNGEEIGRLPRDTAEWVSALVDQKICKFEGVCVFAPERIRVNDTIYLQLRCFLLKEAFGQKSLGNLSDDSEPRRLFEEQETTEEKKLRLRQVALVKLFDEINLHPTSINESMARQKKEGILRAAELAEQARKVATPQNKDGGDSSEDGEEGEKLEEDQLDTLYKKAQSFDFSTPEAQPASSFVLELRKYQKQALHWMLGKEKNFKPEREASMHPLWEEYVWPVKDMDDDPLPQVQGREKFYVNPYSGELTLKFPVQEQNCLGGILADEMGLGKTIEMLSLMHSNKTEVIPVATPEESPLSAASRLLNLPAGETVEAPYTTLVVAPTSLLSQWESEAMKASNAGSMKVLVYYGYDKVDLRYLCSATNGHSAPNLIITSYGVVRSEYSQLGRNSGIEGGLFSVDFFRVILDEAHYIKNRASKTARACYDLKARHRWVLTGTPIVNRLEDLFSLVRFLKVEPWSSFSYWKTFITVPFESKDFLRALNVVQTVLEPLVLRRTKTMKTPDGEALVPLPPRTITVEEVELSQQEREIYDYIFTRAKRTFNENVEAGTLLKSFTTIFAQILRLRQTCCHPVLTRNQNIVAEEEDAAIAANTGNGFKDDMDLQDLIDQFTTSLDEQDSSNQDPTAKFTAHALRQIQTESSGECPICSEDPMIDPAVTACWHSACKKCLEDYVRHQTDKGQTPRCFCCRENLNTRDIFEVVRHKAPLESPGEGDLYGCTPPGSSSSPAPRISLRRINPLSPKAHTSSKVHALISHLQRLPPGTKSVVFSQFTSFLDLISPQLTRIGIEHLRFDGTMHQKARAAVLAKFSAADIHDDIDDDDDAPSRGQRQSKLSSSNPPPPPPSVLLISLRAGGVGLNLTAANHVFVMDPWWSFAVEAQAIDRVHRMGQFRDVHVTRFVVKNSIEGRMLRIQERKMMIAGSLGLRVGGDAGEDDKRKERIEELKLLFE
ncbi:hypothetical protein AJ80_06937 [Polytolypa hystricis UAMH7299]|uniref:DNA repair protein rad5 n=1 Tax=Polytolypa hystricis (strain UAMH7299) TaxID=1447883 RepID=A0A2B7XT96_POLH7|nr:hypothetical protein AJ80_06937 [Polytolypa hystricis UAMH7299]